MITTESILVGVDFSNGTDKSILIVGRQNNGIVTIINALQGKEAEELYKKLVTPKNTD